jgi:hypothetical protein
MSPRHVLRWGLTACCAVTLAGGLAAAVTPAADAATPGYEIAFQANTGVLWFAGDTGAESTGASMTAGTSPNIAVTGPDDFISVFQDAGTLWSAAGTGTPGSWGLAMAPGTDPAVIELPEQGSLSGGVEMAYQGTNGDLWLYGRAAEGDTGLGMLAGTSPSITNLQSGGYQVAFQASTGVLWTMGTDGTYNTGEAMAAGTSPVITDINDNTYTSNENTYFVSIQTSGGTLLNLNWVASNDVLLNSTGLAMAPGTSPSVVDYEFTNNPLIAFQGGNGHIWMTQYTYSGSDTGLAIMAGTSPSVALVQGVGTVLAYQGTNGHLWVATADPSALDWINVDQDLGMMAGTSPVMTQYFPCPSCRIQ